MGRELRDRTFGVIGLGGIGRATVGLLRGFGMKPPLAFDPQLDPRLAVEAGVRLVTLDELLAGADFVSIHCPLNDQTRNLVGRRELARMKPEAYLINTARGGIVNEDALFDALAEHRIAGAALDCFAEEPVTRPHRFGTLDNVLLAPHCIAWTDELFRDIGRSVCQGMLDLSLGKVPRGVVNPEVLESPGFVEKWARCRRGPGGGDPMGRRLEGQTAWISGAASGIGEATARLFAAEGANVVLADVDRVRGTNVCSAILERGGSAVFLACDVSVEEDVRDVLAETAARFGGLNILVNCAGLVHVAPLHEYAEADWDRLMGVNLKGIFFSVKHGLRYLERGPRSYVVNVGSISSFVGQAATPPTRPRRRPCSG